MVAKSKKRKKASKKAPKKGKVPVMRNGKAVELIDIRRKRHGAWRRLEQKVIDTGLYECATKGGKQFKKAVSLGILGLFEGALGGCVVRQVCPLAISIDSFAVLYGNDSLVHMVAASGVSDDYVYKYLWQRYAEKQQEHIALLWPDWRKEDQELFEQILRGIIGIHVIEEKVDTIKQYLMSVYRLAKDDDGDAIRKPQEAIDFMNLKATLSCEAMESEVLALFAESYARRVFGAMAQTFCARGAGSKKGQDIRAWSIIKSKVEGAAKALGKALTFDLSWSIDQLLEGVVAKRYQRSILALEQRGYTSVESLITCSEDDLLTVPNVGASTITTLNEGLKPRDLRIGMTEHEIVAYKERMVKEAELELDKRLSEEAA